MKENIESHYEIDNLDRQILGMLMENAKLPYTEIAKKLIVSPGTIHVRMKKLEDAGVVSGSQLIVNPYKIGYDMAAYLGVHLEKGSVYEEVIYRLERIPEVVEAYYTTGAYGIFMKIYCMNTKHLYDVLNHKIQPINGIHRTETLICLEEGIKRQIQVL
jgi:Lrp/AsnC family transcriptional regulator for asnA, asnC and gidA